MAKWYGTIGFVESKEVSPGVWDDEVTERKYFGEVNRSRRMYQAADQINDNLNISNEFSIVSDPYVDEHIHSMKYLEFKGTRWKITNVEDQYPKLILTVGGVYNG
mgnify:CR=1 FL=1